MVNNMDFWAWWYGTLAFAYAAIIVVALRSLPHGPRRTKIIWAFFTWTMVAAFTFFVKNHLLA